VELQRLVGCKIKQGLSPSYVREIYQLVRTILGFAHKHGLLHHPPVFHVTLPAVPRKEVDPFTPEEIRLLLNTAGEWRELIAFAIWTGCRQGEILAARWQCLDEKRGKFLVKNSLNRQLEFAPTKTKDEGEVWVSKRLLEELDVQKKRSALWRLASSEWQDLDLIFPRKNDGTPQRHSTVKSAFQRICGAAGVPYRSFHTLRHTCASLLLSQNATLKVVQRHLRHKDVKITLGTYSHLLPDDGPQAVENLDRATMGI